jgi:hypothetical protein
MGFWNTPPTPRPGFPGQGRAQPGSAWRDTPLRRADGDAVQLLILFSGFEFSFPLFWPLVSRLWSAIIHLCRMTASDPAAKGMVDPH